MATWHSVFPSFFSTWLSGRAALREAETLAVKLALALKDGEAAGVTDTDAVGVRLPLTPSRSGEKMLQSRAVGGIIINLILQARIQHPGVGIEGKYDVVSG